MYIQLKIITALIMKTLQNDPYKIWFCNVEWKLVSQ